MYDAKPHLSFNCNDFDSNIVYVSNLVEFRNWLKHYWIDANQFWKFGGISVYLKCFRLILEQLVSKDFYFEYLKSILEKSLLNVCCGSCIEL